MKLIDYLKDEQISQLTFSTMVGVSHGMVNQWLTNHRPISPEKCVVIERKTGGKVRREDLRPDDYWLIWPDIKRPKKAA